jgi:hypothetical protein
MKNQNKNKFNIYKNKKLIFSWTYSDYQHLCASTETEVLLIGGIAGVGKTYVAAVEAIRRILMYPNYKVAIFRESGKALETPGGLWDQCLMLIKDLVGNKIFKTRQRPYYIYNRLNNYNYI